ncbi:DUF4124 domain-containing protein [Zooshikella ganghwensis]|uniref:DUF4124 domain-containing protein n=1 Tax=Zooshikella ganghwensis TaxID=202772 RepID=UPI0004010307|nr:DUF4124 domain-containing protein [Zooshikella ganghwensis]
MRPFLLVSITCLVFCLQTQLSHADTFYKWVDDLGVTHYGTRPPEGANAESVKTHAQKPTNQDQATKELEETKVEQTLETKEKEEEARFQKDLAAAKQERKKQCEEARQNKVQLTLKSRVKMKMEDGSIKMLSEEERQAQIKQADEAIKEFCL